MPVKHKSGLSAGHRSFCLPALALPSLSSVDSNILFNLAIAIRDSQFPV